MEGFLAIVGVGVVPNVELAQEAGADVDNGVVVDERFRTSLDDVYAVGDVARYPDPTTGPLTPDRALVERERAGRAPRAPARRARRRRTTSCRSSSRSSSTGSSRCSATSSPPSSASSAARSPTAGSSGFHLSRRAELVGAVVHGQPADVVAELGRLIRDRPVVDDPTRLADESLRPAEAAAV